MGLTPLPYDSVGLSMSANGPLQQPNRALRALFRRAGGMCLSKEESPGSLRTAHMLSHFRLYITRPRQLFLSEKGFDDFSQA
jgi:hypothetical protein